MAYNEKLSNRGKEAPYPALFYFTIRLLYITLPWN